MLDNLQIIFWSITYVLIIISGYRSREYGKIAIPYLATVLNFSWEFNALLKMQGFWAHILWLSLDFFIILIALFLKKSNENKLKYITSIIIMCVVFKGVFELNGGMLLSSFIIDFIMAVCFLIERKRLSNELKVTISITKLFGDLFAGLYYMRYSYVITIVAICVLGCNWIYMHNCIKEKQKEGEKYGESR